MSRTFLVSCMVGLLLTACAGSRRGYLDAHGIALSATDVERAEGSPTPAAETAAGNGAVAADAVIDYGLEQRLRRDLRDRRASGGTAALELIEPGSTVESRLRFALSRQQIGRDTEAVTSLVALTHDAPSCALAWLLLGQARLAGDEAPAAVACLRRARELEREQGLTPHPALNYLLGRALLQTEEDAEGMRLLREELAAGGNRVAAAELLAQVQGDVGDFESALACLDAVLDDVPDEPNLVIAKAELLGDARRFDEALTLLDSRGGRISPPLLLFRRALLLRQRGDARAALALLDQILEQHADEPLVQSALANVRAVRAEVQTEAEGGARSHLRERELLGILRFAEQPVDRARAVRALCANARVAVVPATVRWALRDTHEAVRIAALQVGAGRCQNPSELVGTGLQDAAAEVRAAAAVVAARLPAREGVEPLVAAIERETDPDAFLTLHRALVEVTGHAVTLPFGGERDAAARTRAAQAWRSEVEPAPKDTPTERSRS